MADVVSTLVQHGELETWLNRAGRGRTKSILFLHGSGPGATAWLNWQYALPVFGEHYDSLAPDWIGFGKSTHPDPSPRDIGQWVRMWVDQIIALLDELGIQKTQLVGNSLGGALALRAVIEHPERFDKVVLMGPAGVPMTLTRELDSVWGFFDNPSVARLARAIRWFAYDDSVIGDRLDEIALMRFEAAMNPQVRRSYESMFPAPRQRHVDDLVVTLSDLRRVTNPFLLVYGRDDAFIPLESNHYLLNNLAGPVELHVYGRCSHWIQIEHRERFHQLLLNFFDSGSGARAA